jgi:cobalt-zinc-cadmium efflux system membrane fusion protein
MKNSLLLPIIAFIMASCGNDPSAEMSSSTENAAESALIHLSHAQVRSSGIQTGSFSREQVQEFISAGAELVLGKENTATVSTITDGMVSELKVTLNQSVRKGELIAILHKPGLLDVQEGFLREKERAVFLRAEFERYKGLADENATAGKNLQKAESEWRESQTALALYEARLREFQIDPALVSAEQLMTSIALRAPISGAITAIHVGQGASVGVGSAICEISDFSKVIPVIYIFEKDMFRVKAGSRVRLFFLADPSRKYEASIVSLEGAVDRSRNAIRAFARFNQSVEGLVAGAYLEARIAPEAAVESVVLPEAAVILEGDGAYIFMVAREDKSGFWFRKVEIKTGIASDGKLAIYPVDSIGENASVVIKGAYYVAAQGSGVEIEE